jgi:hypothetical protein
MLVQREVLYLHDHRRLPRLRFIFDEIAVT